MLMHVFSISKINVFAAYEAVPNRSSYLNFLLKKNFVFALGHNEKFLDCWQVNLEGKGWHFLLAFVKMSKNSWNYYFEGMEAKI